MGGVRCVSNYNGSTIDKISNWCKNTGDYTGTTADQGYCFGTTPNTYTSDAHSGLPDSAPFLWGNDKGCDWNAGEDIRVSIHVTAQHKGSHFVDFVPQNEAQLEVCRFALALRTLMATWFLSRRTVSTISKYASMTTSTTLTETARTSLHGSESLSDFTLLSRSLANKKLPTMLTTT